MAEWILWSVTIGCLVVPWGLVFLLEWLSDKDDGGDGTEEKK